MSTLRLHLERGRVLALNRRQLTRRGDAPARRASRRRCSFNAGCGCVNAGDHKGRPYGYRAASRLVGLRWDLARKTPLLCLGLVYAFAFAASDNEPKAQDRLDTAAISALFDHAILDDGGIGDTIERLTTTAKDTAKPDRERADAWLTVAHVHWRYGHHAQAVAATDKALAIATSADGSLLKARLLDATGDAEQATDWYEKAARATDLATEKEFIALRLTMAQASNRNIDVLVDLAKERDQAFRNRAAITLALLGHPVEAIALYQASPAFGNPFRQHARLAHWATETEDFERAQEESWRAHQAAATRADKLYALALLVESHRKDDALDELLDQLAEATSGSQPDPDLLQARVDLLTETENYDGAIAFYETLDAQAVNPAARRRLINLYEAAGRTEDMVAEYDKLMATEPEVVHWYAGLASHYLNLARPDDAFAVWERLAAANQDRVEVLVEAATAMVQMGFVAEAVSMIQDHMGARDDSLPGLLFLFELRLARGENDKALATLERLEAGLEDGTTGIRDLADAYERINRPEEAIRILERLHERQGELGYDERTRLAWLYSVAGRKDDALTAWRGLWVSVDSAARRSLAESQFLLLATELNTLGDLVVDLEEQLVMGEADRNEMGLLVRIYTEVGDNFSATEVIEEFARYSDAGEVDRLRRLGKVHRMLADHSAYDKVLRQLVEADPENEVEHIQNIVLNMLAFDLAEESQGRFGEIQRWLGRLRELDAEGVSGEFEAGIFSMGGFNEEAIESYRRALVIHPENSDNLLLMADLMKDAGRRDEAVALLQYAAEHAEDDSGFVVAIDGIINMIGARSFAGDLTPEMRRTFRWAQRIILERIAGHNDKFYLYQLLADIAQEVGDIEAEFLAVENSLSEAGVRRPAALRELVTLATAGAGFAGFSTGAGHPERQLTHGRRLIGLKQELPPEVYINLGKVLLEKGAVQGAVHAFDLIDDITGLINVDKTKADLFLEAGHPAEALTWYTRALNVNKDDLALLTRAAMLREANGQDEVANALYFRALGNVLRAQPTARRKERPGANQSPLALLGLPGPDTSVTRDYRTYFEALAQGLLITWPDDRKTSDEREAATRAMFDAEFDAVAGESAPPSESETTDTLDLAEFPRLERITWFARRVAERAAAGSLSEHVETKLRGHFEDEPTGLGAADTNESLLDRQLRLAKSGDDFEATVRLARLAGDEDVTEVFRGRIVEGKYREGLAYARALLDPVTFKRMAAAIAPTLKDNGPAIVELIEADPDLVLEIEADLGRELISGMELQDLLAEPELQANLNNPYLFRESGTWKYLRAKTDVDSQIRYFASNVVRQRRGQQFRSFNASNMLHDLLATELSAAQQDNLLAAATGFFSKQDLADEFARRNAISDLLNSRVISSNYPVVLELGALIQRRAQLAFDLPSMLKDILEGGVDQAFATLVALSRAGIRYLPGLSGDSEKYAASRARIFQAMADGEEIDAEVVRIVYEFEFPRYFGTLNRDRGSRQVEILPTLITRYPDDGRYRRELVAAHWDLGNRAEAEAALAECYRENPEHEFLRAALYFLFLYDGKYHEALRLVTDGGPDLRDQAAVDDLLAKVRSTRSFESAAGDQLFRKVYQGSIEPSFSRFSGEVDRGIEALRAAAKADPDAAHEAGRRALRTVWRGVQAPSEERQFSPEPGYMTNLLLSMPLSTDSSDDSRFGFDPYGAPPHRLDDLLAAKAEEEMSLFEAIAREPYGVVEFDLYLRSMPTEQRRGENRLYQLLADAVVAAGRLDETSGELTGRLRDLDDHEFTVWMLLRFRQNSPVGAAELDAFAGRANAVEDSSKLQILSMARIYAKAGTVNDASQLYRLLVAKLVRHNEFADRRAVVFTGFVEPLVDLSQLIQEFVQTLPPTVARDTAVSIIATARRADRHDAYTAYFDTFVLRIMSVLYGPKEAIAQAARLSSTSVAVSLPLPEWHGTRFVELARLHAMSGDVERAVKQLRAFVIKVEDELDRTPEEPFDQARYEMSSALRNLARVYGLTHLDRFDEPVVPFHDLIANRDRLFPASDDNRWSGDTAWMTSAAEALVSWLDDPDIDRAAALEVAFVVAWQLHDSGETDDAKAVLSGLAARINADPNRHGLQHLALMALRLGNVLPVDLAAEVLGQGTLTVDQEVEVLEGLQGDHDPATVLAVGREVPRAAQKLPLMRLLRSLADAAGDSAYAENLRQRIETAEEARRNLRLDARVDPTLK